MKRCRRYARSKADCEVRSDCALVSGWLQFRAHGGADHDVLTECKCRVPRGKRKIRQSDVSRDAEAAVMSWQVPINGFLSFVPNDGVLYAGRVTRRGGVRRS